MPLVQIANEKINYIERGSGAVPLVFIHGAGSSHLIWGAQVRALGARTRAIALDLPGHNKSQGDGRDSIAAYAEVVRVFLDALAIQRAVIVGHSMGGAIAQVLALSHPGRVAALALIATGSRLRVSPMFLNGFRDEFDATVDQIGAYYFGAGVQARLREKSAMLLRACGQRVVLGDFSACNAFDLAERIAEIRAPTLVICGREDSMTPPKYSEFLAAKIPHAQLTLIDGAGHHVMIEKPEEVNRKLREWVQNI